MEINFADKKLAKIMNDMKGCQKKFGQNMAKKIMMRLSVLKAAKNLAEVPPEKPDRRHALSGDRKGQFAVDLDHPFRLIFKPEGEPEVLPDGGIDLTKVTSIVILGVEDYHGK